MWTEIKALVLILMLAFAPLKKASSQEWLTPEFKKENITDVSKKLVDKTSLSLWFIGAVTSLHFKQIENDAREDWRNHQQMSAELANAGDFLGSGFATAAIIAGQYYWDDNKENWQNHARAFAWEAATVTVLKYSFGKQRPGDRNNYVSFPSGHTATAFATATSLTYAYGWKAGFVAYPLAAFVGASRMADDMHWLSDVVAGAFVGIIIGRATQSDPAQSSSLVVPVIDRGTLGLNYYYRF
ncbi:MAG: hypothetical protein K0R29_2335 [Pseudobdellovibrio sp.]|jgi:hypothetical protein|nr:hypothetical protein [Pseudobdellovibrio sp.]